MSEIVATRPSPASAKARSSTVGRTRDGRRSDSASSTDMTAPAARPMAGRNPFAPAPHSVPAMLLAQVPHMGTTSPLEQGGLEIRRYRLFHLHRHRHVANGKVRAFLGAGLVDERAEVAAVGLHDCDLGSLGLGNIGEHANA